MRVIAFVLSGLILAGCSSAPEKPGPTDLERIQFELDLVEIESVSLGGQDVTDLVPVVTEAGVFAASSDGELTLLELPSFDDVWTVDTDQPISAGVGADASHAYVVTVDGRLKAYAVATGQLVFERQLPSAVTAPPVSDGQRVFVKTQVGRLMALSAVDGQTLWVEESQATTIGIRGSAPMTLQGNVLWVLWESGRLAGYQADNGRVVLERQVAVSRGRSPLERIVDSKGAPSIQNNALATATRNGQLSVIDLQTGQSAWSIDVDAYPGAVVGFNAVTVVQTDGTVAAYSVQSGELLWATEALRYRELSAPAIFGNAIAVVDLEGILHLLDPADGRLVARLDLGSAKGSVAPVPFAQGLLVQLVDGRLSWVGLEP